MTDQNKSVDQAEAQSEPVAWIILDCIHFKPCIVTLSEEEAKTFKQELIVPLYKCPPTRNDILEEALKEIQKRIDSSSKDIDLVDVVLGMHTAYEAVEELKSNAQPTHEDFDTWLNNPYTKVLQKSIKEDYVPKTDAQPVADQQDKKDTERLDYALSILWNGRYFVTDTGCGCCGDGKFFDENLTGREAIDLAMQSTKEEGNE